MGYPQLDSATLKILELARVTYGFQNQISVAAEECGELSVALMKYSRYKNHERAVAQTHDSVLDEVVDVLIVLDHITSVYGFTDHEIKDRIKVKIARLSRWMDTNDSMEQTTVDREV